MCDLLCRKDRLKSHLLTEHSTVNFILALYNLNVALAKCVKDNILCQVCCRSLKKNSFQYHCVTHHADRMLCYVRDYSLTVEDALCQILSNKSNVDAEVSTNYLKQTVENIVAPIKCLNQYEKEFLTRNYNFLYLKSPAMARHYSNPEIFENVYTSQTFAMNSEVKNLCSEFEMHSSGTYGKYEISENMFEYEARVNHHNLSNILRIIKRVIHNITALVACPATIEEIFNLALIKLGTLNYCQGSNALNIIYAMRMLAKFILLLKATTVDCQAWVDYEVVAKNFITATDSIIHCLRKKRNRERSNFNASLVTNFRINISGEPSKIMKSVIEFCNARDLLIDLKIASESSSSGGDFKLSQSFIADKMSRIIGLLCCMQNIRSAPYVNLTHRHICIKDGYLEKIIECDANSIVTHRIRTVNLRGKNNKIVDYVLLSNDALESLTYWSNIVRAHFQNISVECSLDSPLFPAFGEKLLNNCFFKSGSAFMKHFNDKIKRVNSKLCLRTLRRIQTAEMQDVLKKNFLREAFAKTSGHSLQTQQTHYIASENQSDVFKALSDIDSSRNISSTKPSLKDDCESFKIWKHKVNLKIKNLHLLKPFIRTTKSLSRVKEILGDELYCQGIKFHDKIWNNGYTSKKNVCQFVCNRIHCIIHCASVKYT